jgi:cyclopropane fatty-acyl-phospholipid synthase-like methyltransferase
VFDEERGVDTATWVRVPELDTSSANVEYAVRYEPSSVEEFHLLMDKLRVDHREFTFVDYGSGKGRVLMLAAELPFKRIVGVEFAESLDRIARQNIATLGADAGRIETHLGDATEFDPPEGPLVLYFFHPFGVPALRRVLDRVHASLELDPRPAYVVLTGPPELAQTVEGNGFQRVDVDELGWLTRGVFVAKAGVREPVPTQAVGEEAG